MHSFTNVLLLLLLLQAHLGPVMGLAVSSDSTLCASISTDRTAKVRPLPRPVPLLLPVAACGGVAAADCRQLTRLHVCGLSQHYRPQQMSNGCNVPCATPPA
jgi:hypothetical protein